MWRSKKRLLIAIAVVLIPLSLLTWQHGRSQGGSRSVLTLPFDAANALLSHMAGSLHDWVSAVEENRSLKADVSRLLIEQQQYQEALNENRRLRELLNLRQSSRDRLIFSNIVGRGYDRLQTSVIADKGEPDGIRKDMPALTARGLIGKVLTVRGEYSEILLLRDPSFSTAVRLQQSRHEGIISGTGSRLLSLKYIAPEEPVAIGEAVVTSGLDGVFPEGIPVGTVATVNRDGGGFFQAIEVQPFQDDVKLEEVAFMVKRAR
ncbi:MAG TPA: rod shape-determining protein MreC [Dissulfurispiraceae bacterium]|nr:rod shape-determining protein MreC [Dissulfurispiraceae bacterium]